MEPIRIKSISLLFLLLTLSACASTTKSNGSLQLMDGFNLFTNNGKLVKITDKTGNIVSKRGMLELANGDFIYIRRDGTVTKIEENKPSHEHNSKSSSSAHSH